MMRIHFSPDPIREVRTVPQHPSIKPSGLWYAFDDMWNRFLRGRKILYHHGREAKYQYEIKLNISGRCPPDCQNPDILLINSVGT